MVDKSEKITQELVFDLADRLTAQGLNQQIYVYAN